MSDPQSLPQNYSSFGTDPEFENHPRVAALRRLQQEHNANARARLAEDLKKRGRDKPIFPDDEDLMRWYNDNIESSLKQWHRGMQDLRELYRRGEL